MASELRVNTLKDASGNNSVGLSYVAQTPKAWINYNGDNTSTIRDSFNCGSMTDGGTGDHTVNYTNNFANTGYAPMSNCQSGDASNPASAVMNSQGNVTTSSSKIYTTQDSNGVFDSEHMSLLSTGDLA